MGRLFDVSSAGSRRRRQRRQVGDHVASKQSRRPRFQEKPKKSYDAFASA
jgi:hypothetical protein